MRIIKGLIGAAALVVILLTLPPFAIRWFLVSELEALNNQTQISHVGFNIFTGEISLYDVQIRTVEGDEFNVFSATFELDLLALLDRRIVIERVVVNSAHIDARRDGDKWVVAGFGRALTLPKYAGDIAVEIYSVTVVNSELCRAAQAQCLRVEEGYLNQVTLKREANEWSFAHNGHLRLVKAFLRERTSSSTLFYVGELNIESGSYAPNLLSLRNAQFQNVQFIQSEEAKTDVDASGTDAPYQTQVGDLLFSSIQWGRVGEMESLNLGPVTATSVRQALQRNAQSALVLPIRVRVWAKRFARKFAANTLHFTFTELNALDCAIAWTDQSVTPAAQMHVASLKIKLGAIDSASAAAATAFFVEGKVGANGKLKFDGTFAPFLTPAQFSVSGVVESLAIDSLSGYSLALLDQRVQKGEIDFNLKATADKGVVKASSRWQWTNFVIEPSRGGSNMPLGKVYEILKDHNSSIKFDLNVSGNINSKALEPHTIFANQLRGLLDKMAQGQIGAVSEPSAPGGSKGSQILTFAPFYYAASARYLSESEFARLNEIAALLVSKPQVKATFCPVLTGGEWLANFYASGPRPTPEVSASPDQVQNLLELGTARGRALFSALLEAGVGVDQIILCKPRLDLTQSGMSYISVSL